MSDQPSTPLPETPPKDEALVIDEAALEAALKENTGLSNVYKDFAPDSDRDRLITQAQLFSQFLQLQAPRRVLTTVRRFLDIGCGEGQLTYVLSKLYKSATGIGIDKDPAAIEGANKRISRIVGSHGPLEFVVGDIQEKLPDGPFDLIYGSAIMLYVQQTEKALKLMYDALAPGGYVWIKDASVDSFVKALPDPTYQFLYGQLADMVIKMGARVDLYKTLPAMMTNIGFQDPKVFDETYIVTNDTLSGRMAMSALFGAIYNGHKMVCKVQNIPEEDYLKQFNDMTGRAASFKGRVTYPNILARRPL